jgi:hypothetical protein
MLLTLLRQVKSIVHRAKEFLKAIAISIASWPLQALPMRIVAKAVEDLAENMVSVVPLPDGQILFHTPSPVLIWRAQSLLTKEVDTTAWIDGFEKGAVFWDVGANSGVYTLYAAIPFQSI